MTLSTKQQLFAQRISVLILALIERGYEVTLGETWRPCQTAALYAQEGIGIKDSLHTRRLAEDLNLFKGGVFLTTEDEYREAGQLWKSYSTADAVCCWGGDFASPDADHFSIADGNQK